MMIPQKSTLKPQSLAAQVSTPGIAFRKGPAELPSQHVALMTVPLPVPLVENDSHQPHELLPLTLAKASTHDLQSVYAEQFRQSVMLTCQPSWVTSHDPSADWLKAVPLRHAAWAGHHPHPATAAHVVQLVKSAQPAAAERAEGVSWLSVLGCQQIVAGEGHSHTKARTGSSAEGPQAKGQRHRQEERGKCGRSSLAVKRWSSNVTQNKRNEK